MSYKRIISCLLIISIFVSILSISSYADNTVLGGFDAVSFWEEVIENSHLATFFDQFIDDNFDISSGCSGNNGGAHEWVFNNALPLTPGIGYYTCAYCGMNRSDYVADAYDDYVEDLPVDSIDNSGNLIFIVRLSNIYDRQVYRSASAGYEYYSFKSSSRLNRYDANCNISFFMHDRSCGFTHSLRVSATSCNHWGNWGVSGKFNYPCSGTFTKIDGSSCFSSKTVSVNNLVQSFTCNLFCELNLGTFTCYFPSFRYIPPSDSDYSDTYTDSTRITNYTLNLGTIVNGSITNVYNNTTIINETDKTLTVPSTGTTYNINNWVYNYTDRSVSGTLDSGDNYDVTFGDDNLIIHIGDDEYTYHYLVEHEVCDHTYVVTDSTSPTCTEFGSETFTCSKCGDSYTENIAPLGHDYQLVQSVPASGEDAGYDLYRCTRCGDEYQDSTFVNDASDDASYWAWLKNWLVSFKTWLGDKLDALLNKDASVNVDQDITIDLPDIDFGIEFADDSGEIHVWHPDDLKAKFAFWKDVRDIGTELYASVQPTAMRSSSTTGPPELIIHLGDANSHYGFEYGGDEYAMDLSWYDEYKPTVDSIVGGFLWLLYLYGVFKHLPEILSGVGMMDNRIEDIQSGNKGSRRRNG